jgi:DNA-binding response OmpR family regulator
MEQKPPDVIVLGREWPERALLRAQLIEEGYEVVAIDEWPIPRLYRRPGTKPRVLLIDLYELPKPRETLDEVRFVLPIERVMVITALGSLTADEVKRLGFHVLERPVSIREIVSAIGALLTWTPPEGNRNGTTSARTE